MSDPPLPGSPDQLFWAMFFYQGCIIFLASLAYFRFRPSIHWILDKLSLGFYAFFLKYPVVRIFVIVWGWLFCFFWIVSSWSLVFPRYRIIGLLIGSGLFCVVVMYANHRSRIETNNPSPPRERGRTPTKSERHISAFRRKE